MPPSTLLIKARDTSFKAGLPIYPAKRRARMNRLSYRMPEKENGMRSFRTDRTILTNRDS